MRFGRPDDAGATLPDVEKMRREASFTLAGDEVGQGDRLEVLVEHFRVRRRPDQAAADTKGFGFDGHDLAGEAGLPHVETHLSAQSRKQL